MELHQEGSAPAACAVGLFSLKIHFIVDKDFNQKCDTCNFDSNKDKVKIENI